MKYYLGLDIGGTKTILRLEDENGNQTARKKIPTPKTVPALFEAVNGFVSESGDIEPDIAAMCCGVPGSVSPSGEEIGLIPSLGWEGGVLAEELFSKFSFPCAAVNDVNCALWAHAAEKKDKVVFFMAIGTGVGGAVSVGGKVLTGASGCAGEIGYMISAREAGDIVSGKRKPYDGFGALESKISGTALEKTASSLGYENSTVMFDDALSPSPQNAKAKDAVNDFLLYLAAAIANCAAILDPDEVIIGGGVSNSLPPYMGRLKEIIRKIVPIDVCVSISPLKNDAGAVGACRAARYLFENGSLF